MCMYRKTQLYYSVRHFYFKMLKFRWRNKEKDKGEYYEQVRSAG